MMHTNDVLDLVHIVDDFYQNPDDIRAIALDQSYSIPPAPGLNGQGGLAYRVDCPDSLSQELVTKISHIIVKPASNAKVQFRYSLQGTQKRNICHADGVEYAGIVYLSLPDDCQGGTHFFRHKPTGHIIKDSQFTEQYRFDIETDWDIVYKVEMKYNRLVLYPGDLFHAIGLPFFGTSVENARLTQNLFIPYHSNTA